MKIESIVKDDRPRERLLSLGPSCLTEAELLAVLLGSGTRGKNAVELAQEILCVATPKRLAELTAEDLTAIKGVGMAKRCLLLAVGELLRRSKESLGGKPNVFSLVRGLAEKETLVEEAYAYKLGNRLEVMSSRLVAKGAKQRLIVDPTEILHAAVGQGCHRFAFVHTHPYGFAYPSKEDIEATLELQKDASRIGMDLYDHFLVAPSQVFSFREHGLLNKRKPKGIK